MPASHGIEPQGILFFRVVLPHGPFLTRVHLLSEVVSQAASSTVTRNCVIERGLALHGAKSVSSVHRCRFGDTAANVGVLALLESFESTRTLPLPVKSAAGSITAGLWRIALTPIDTYKTTLQVRPRTALALIPG